jgi:uncharacterized phiE125 gp8 family phage protein
VALSPYAPFTMEQLRRWLRVSDTSFDATLEEIGNAVTDEIERLTNRLYVQRTVSEIRDGDGGRRLELRRYPVSAVTSFTVDDAAVAAADYDLDKEGGVIWLLNGKRLTRGERNVKVTYTAGYVLADVPAEVTRVAREMAKVIWDEWQAGVISAASVNVGPASYVVRPGWPYHVMAALEGLRREVRAQAAVV